MDWSSELVALRQEMEPTRRELERQGAIDEAERQQRLAEVKDLCASLAIEEDLGEVNRVLLDGHGELELYTPWDDEAEEDTSRDKGYPIGDDEVEGDSVSAILTWEEQGSREIAVDLGITLNGYYLQVNGKDVRPERDAVRQALIQAFREALQG